MNIEKKYAVDDAGNGGAQKNNVKLSAYTNFYPSFAFIVLTVAQCGCFCGMQAITYCFIYKWKKCVYKNK